MKIIIGKCLLQNILDEKGWDQVTLAEKTGLSKSQINDYISNRRKMSLKNLYLVAYAVNRPTDSLYQYKIIVK